MNPLEKLRAALEEYLASGEDTPVAAEAQALLGSLDAAGPAGPPPGDLSLGAPPMGGLPMEGAMPPPPMEGDMPPMEAELPPVEEEMPPPQNAKTFEGARPGAKDRLKKLNRR